MSIEARKSVLVVEDSVDLLDVIRQHLETEGYEVFPATHGKQAIDFLASLPGPLPDLVVLDLMMPIMNGWDVLREMRLQPRFDTTPVLVMTAAAETKPQGAAALIRKPFNLEDFVNAVRATSRKPASDQS